MNDIDRGPYTYDSEFPAHPAPNQGTGDESLLAVRASLLKLTGGCEVCRYSSGLYCERDGQPVRKDGSRCGYFDRPWLHAGNENPSNIQIMRYVNDILGIRDRRSVKRLTG